MTLPSSGALTLSDIQTEFGGSNPISLSEYYAGGAYVPAGTSGTYGAVPSSGAIGIRNFYGTSSVVISFTNTYVETIVTTPDVAEAVYDIRTNGNSYVNYSLYEQWCTPTSAATNYEVYATLTSGSLTYGTTGSWLPVTSILQWYVQRTSIGTSTASLSMQVRRTGTSTVLDTWTVDFVATVDV